MDEQRSQIYSMEILYNPTKGRLESSEPSNPVILAGGDALFMFELDTKTNMIIEPIKGEIKVRREEAVVVCIHSLV